MAIWVLGAGSIGCFVGGRLQAAGASVAYIGRSRIGAAVRGNGLTLSDLEAPTRRLPADMVAWHETLPPGTPDLVLLCVKSAATAEAAAQLAGVLPPGTPVLSLQNGVDNPRVAQAAAPRLRVIAGMVPFNVAELGPGHFHRGSTGPLAAANDAALQPFLGAFEAAGLPLRLHDDMAAVQWAKLLLNLNNPVNALSGLPLRAQLLDARWRRLTAALMAEALDVLRAADLPLARITPLPTAWLPAVMRLPTPLFRLVAASSLRIDAQARSSMADDLAQGREPEIDALCGAIVRLGEAQGLATPRNRAMVGLMAQRRSLPLAEVAAAMA